MLEQICVQFCKLCGRGVRHKVVQVVRVNRQIVVLDKVLGIVKLAVHRVGRVGQRANTRIGVVLPVTWINIMVAAFHSSNTARAFTLHRQFVVNVGMALVFTTFKQTGTECSITPPAAVRQARTATALPPPW